METEEVKMKIGQWQMRMHMSMAKENAGSYHTTITWPGNEIDGKILVHETHTPQKGDNFAKQKNSFYLNEKNSPIFETTKAFIDHYTKKENNGTEDKIQP